MIRPIDISDIPACVAIIRESFSTVAREFGITKENAPRFTAFSVTEARIAAQLSWGRPCFAYSSEDGTLCGYYSLAPGDDGSCELNNLCVLPGYRHRGIGEQLLRHALSCARERGFHTVKLSYVAENVRLGAWYESFGFVAVETVKFDFFPFTCTYMTLELAPETV